MPRNEEGEYELVLGTPQLLSVVFILLVLLGLVFSAGYYLGRSTAGEVAPAAEEAGKRAPTAAQTPSAARPPQAGQPLEPGEVKVAPGVAAASAETPLATAAPAPEVSKTQATPAPAALEEAPYPEPAPGQTFVQVAAVRRTEAEMLADVLKRKGFPALVAPGPSETLFRVLVGPLKDEEEIARTRQRLEEAGFRSSYVRKY